jgi:hypothetical protein
MQYLKNMNGMDRCKYFFGKSIAELTLEELAFIHLDINQGSRAIKDGYFLSSNLYDLVETLSASFSNRRTRIYVPLMTEFAILDQVGCLYGNKSTPTKYQNGIKNAFDIFSSFNDRDDLESLVTLRHGLLHSGSLVNTNRNTGTNVAFRMKQDTGQVLTNPQQPWDGVYHDDLTSYLTFVDLKELQKLTISIIEKCMEGKRPFQHVLPT